LTNRRAILKSLGAAVLARPFAAGAQQAQRVRRIGYLAGFQSSAPATRRGQELVRETLRRRGWEEGKNLVIEWRYAEGNVERLPALAEELVGSKVELIVAVFNSSITAASRATRTVPIVMHAGTDPVGNGFVKTLARPGGNITGTVWSGPETAGKILEIVKQTKPGAVQVATLANSSPVFQLWKRENDSAARALGVSVQYFDVDRAEELLAALERVAAARPDALVAWGDAITISRARELTAFAIERKITLISNSPVHADEGALVAYAPDLSALRERTASFVDRILRGATAAELPVEQPTKFELIVNAKTARAIGLNLPPVLLLRATRVIE
jgi:putative ABC transport system substrate-binding protein